MEPDLDVTGLIPDLDDRDPQTIIDDALAYVQASLPGYRPVNGSLDVILLEAMALSVADAIYAANRIPGVVLAGMLALNDIPRDAGRYTTGSIEITLDGPRSVVIPTGHRFSVNGVEFWASASVSSSASTITVPVVAAQVGTEGNGLADGTEVELLDPVPWAVAAATVGMFSGGAEIEDDAAYLARAATRLPQMTSALLLPSSYTAFAAGLPDVSRAQAVDLYDGVGTPGEEEGHITVYAHGHGAPLTAARLAELQADMEMRSASHLRVHVLAATVTNVPVTVSVRLQPGVNQEAVLAAVEVALREEVSPARWTWSETVTPQEISAIAARVAGVDYTLGVSAPAVAVNLPVGALPQATSVSVTAG